MKNLFKRSLRRQFSILCRVPMLLMIGFVTLGFASVRAEAAVGRTAGAAGVSNSGTASYSIPIFAPPGPNGMTPHIGLAYSSGNGNGLAGIGWAITGLSSITRCPQTLAQNGTARSVQLDAEDRFCLDGNQLKLVGGSYGAAGSEYRTEIESFSRITADGTYGDGPGYFYVDTKEGQKLTYGNWDDSRIEAYGSPTIRTWLLSVISDRDGNSIYINYYEDSANGSYRPKEITWNHHPSNGNVSAYKMEFIYEARPDVLISSVAGGRVRETQRLGRVDVTYNGNIVRRYTLSYQISDTTLVSRMSSIQECGAGGADCFAATTATYQAGGTGWGAYTVPPGVTFPANYIGGGMVAADVNGDGIPDLLFIEAWTGAIRYAIGNANGTYRGAYDAGFSVYYFQDDYGNVSIYGLTVFDFSSDGSQAVTGVPAGTTPASIWKFTSVGSPFTAIYSGGPLDPWANLQPIDFDGDGRMDLISASPGAALTWYRNTGSGFAAGQVILLLSGNESHAGTTYSGPADLSTRFLDFDADGRTDVIMQVYDAGASTSRVAAFRSTGTSYQEVGSWPINGQSVTILPTDVDGDGCSDFVLKVTDYQQTVSSNNLIRSTCGRTGGAMFEEPVAIPQVGTGYNWFEVDYDWDGDGRKDLLSAVWNGSYTDVYAYRSKGDGYETTGTLVCSNCGVGLSVADLNGDGLDDIYAADSVAGAFELHNGNRPDLLTTITDGFGNYTTFNYTTLARGNYTKYASAVFPEQDYQGAQNVVASFTASDGIGGAYTKGFWYYGANVNLQGRGAEGFYARYDEDSRNGVRNVQYFNRLFPVTGTLLQSESYPPAVNNYLQLTQNSWTYVLASGSTGYETRYIPYVGLALKYNYESGGPYNAALLKTTTTTVNAFDATSGTATDQTTSVVEPASGANGIYPGQSWTARTYISSILDDTTNWCLGRPQSVQQINSHTLTNGTALTRTKSTNWDAVNCRPTQTTEQPGDPLALTTAIGYDGFGNVSSTTKTGSGIGTRTTTTNWGSSGQFPVSVTGASGTAIAMTTQKGWDYAKGVQASETDPNGITVSWLSDDFGRKTRENRPDGTYSNFVLTACTSSEGYCGTGFATVPVRSDRFDYSTTGVLLNGSLVYTDMQDRVRWNYTNLNRAGQWEGTYRYLDSFGRVTNETLRFNNVSGSMSSGSRSHTYDLLGRETLEQTFNTGGTLVGQTSAQYLGLQTVVTDANGKYRKRWANAIGQTVQSNGQDIYQQTFSFDAFGNAISAIDSDGVTLQSNTFNIRGMKTNSTDADMGAWGYAYNALGELTSQTDANAQTISLTYDAFGRKLTSTEPSPSGGTLSKSWVWGNDLASKNFGKLYTASVSGSGVTSYFEAHFYDSVGREFQTNYYDGSVIRSINSTYASDTGLVDSVTYPTTIGSRFSVVLEYQYGFLFKVRDPSSQGSVIYWQANAADARGNITQDALGNGIVTNRAFDAATGFIQSIQSDVGGGTAIQNLNYSFDAVGNLLSRNNANQALTESFTYDSLYRVLTSSRNGSVNFSASYLANGNINDKWDNGLTTAATLQYTYSPTKLHAVTSIDLAGVGGTWSYSYDANGNITSKTGSSVTWYANNKPRIIAGPGVSSAFEYTADGAYWKQTGVYSNATETTTYLGDLLEIASNSATGLTAYRHYIKAGDRTVAIVTRGSNKVNTVLYPLSDHLGSTEAITNSTGALVVRESFSAFGSRRDSAWVGVPSTGDMTAIANATRRGYSGHTEIDNLNLIHMNGRVFDPGIGRFLSADPNIDGEMDPQGWNRYSYVKNNPLSFTDPSGFDAAAGPQQDIQEVVVQAQKIKPLKATFPMQGSLERDIKITGSPAHAPRTMEQSLADRIGDGYWRIRGTVETVLGTLEEGFLSEYLNNPGAIYFASDEANDANAQALDSIGQSKSGACATNESCKAGVPYVQPFLAAAITIGAGRVFTRAQKRSFLDANRKANGGVLRSTKSGQVLAPARKSERGVTPPSNEVAIDHRIPKAAGGTNDPSNHDVLSRKENGDKSDSMP